MPLQAIDDAMDRNPVVYQANNLQMPQCIIPTNVIKDFSPYETYIAQITAHSNATQIGSLDYINIVNEGKSDIKMFRVKDYSETPAQPATYSRPKLMPPKTRSPGRHPASTMPEGSKYHSPMMYESSNPQAAITFINRANV